MLFRYIVWLLDKSNIALEEEMTTFINEFNKFQLSGRYPDYANDIYKMCTNEFTSEQLSLQGLLSMTVNCIFLFGVNAMPGRISLCLLRQGSCVNMFIIVSGGTNREFFERG